jgi:predicted alpha/beta superfamily hydrolase
MSTQFFIDGQAGWSHHDSLSYGYYHTYDHLFLEGDVRKVQIFLPADYEERKQKYPVVFMNDGHTAFYSGGLSAWSWEANKTVDSLFRNNTISKVIIVAVYPVDRNRQYLPEGNEFAKANGTGDRYLSYYSNYLANVLIPFLERNYDIDFTPVKTSIVGSSLGAIASFYTAAKFNNKIGVAGAISPSFHSVIDFVKDSICPESSAFMREIGTYLKAAAVKPSLWIDWGKYEESVAENAPVIIKELQKKYGYETSKNLFFVDDQLGTHDERAWGYRFGLFLKTFYPKK